LGLHVLSTLSVILAARSARRIVRFAGLAAAASLAAATSACAQPAPVQSAAPQPAASPAPERLPARLVTCSLGHATNFDPEKQQKLSDITYDTHHRLTLYLPGIDARTAPPPDAVEPAEAVDPATRVTEDPDGLTSDAPWPFDRVVDLWPDRVELAKTMASGTYKTLLVSNYNPANGTARMFLGTAADLTTYDLKRLYLGECTVTLNPPAPAKAP